MSVFPQFERDLLAAAEGHLARKVSARDEASALTSGARGQAGRSRRRMRTIAIALVCVLAVTTVALAAGGVILTGAPVHPEELLNRNVGEGIPARGQSRLLPLRVPDPEGGLPWGMRVVHTTRGEVCVQVGRVQGGKLGVLGIDGEFHDDGRFHPLPADALPADVFHGHAFDTLPGNANTTCTLAGAANASQHIGLDRGAGPNPHALRRPLRELRNVYYGLLGPQAVSVTYKAGDRPRTIPVLPDLGAYLIVGRTHRHQLVESGGGSLGTPGDLPPSSPLTVITYKIDGRVCGRVRSDPFAPHRQVSDPCPWPRFHHSASRLQDLHRQLHVQLRAAGRTITTVRLTFLAPFAVTSAREHYLVEIPIGPCPIRAGAPAGDSRGYTQVGIARNVRRGARLTIDLSPQELFTYHCGRRRTVQRRAVAIEVLYEPGPGRRMVVGGTTVREPAGHGWRWMP